MGGSHVQKQTHAAAKRCGEKQDFGKGPIHEQEKRCARNPYDNIRRCPHSRRWRQSKRRKSHIKKLSRSGSTRRRKIGFNGQKVTLACCGCRAAATCLGKDRPQNIDNKDKTIHRIVTSLFKLGWTIRRGKKHNIIKSPTSRVLTVPTTPSDRRAVQNFRHNMRHAAMPF